MVMVMIMVMIMIMILIMIIMIMAFIDTLKTAMFGLVLVQKVYNNNKVYKTKENECNI